MATTSPSIKLIKASDGSGNASVVTIQATRSPGATTIQADTVVGIPTNFYASMGTPHTFVDPVTGETITVISEDTAVDFEGHVDTGDLEIDAIAAGYVDDGSAVGDIVIIRPTTPYANNIAAVLNVAHNDNGTIKNDAITTKDQFVDALDPVLRGSEYIFDHVASGLVWSGDAYGSTRAASMTAGVVYIGGIRVPVSLITARTFTASKDTYIDVGTDGVVDYSEVANNAASPALAASHIRIGIIVTAAGSIAAVGSVNQGQQDKILPIASSQAYQVTDSLGNLICPRDPTRRILGYRQIVSVFSSATSGSDVDVTGLSAPVIVPTGRRVRIRAFTEYLQNSNAAGNGMAWKIKESTTVLQEYVVTNGGSNWAMAPGGPEYVGTPSAGSHTYKMALNAGAAGTWIVNAAATAPAFIIVELV